MAFNKIERYDRLDLKIFHLTRVFRKFVIHSLFSCKFFIHWHSVNLCVLKHIKTFVFVNHYFYFVLLKLVIFMINSYFFFNSVLFYFNWFMSVPHQFLLFRFYFNWLGNVVILELILSHVPLNNEFKKLSATTS